MVQAPNTIKVLDARSKVLADSIKGRGLDWLVTVDLEESVEVFVVSWVLRLKHYKAGLHAKTNSFFVVVCFEALNVKRS
jgi:hypothetical protein